MEFPRTVTLEKDVKTGELVAAKHISFDREKAELIREISGVAQLNHPNVLQIVGGAFADSSQGAELQTEYVPDGMRASLWNPTGIGKKGTRAAAV
jgi:hypothetical protein